MLGRKGAVINKGIILYRLLTDYFVPIGLILIHSLISDPIILFFDLIAPILVSFLIAPIILSVVISALTNRCSSVDVF